MLAALASAMALRRRGFPTASPPPERAATVISLINLVNSLPRLSSSAPFLCLIECHFECPDISASPSTESSRDCAAIYHNPARRLISWAIDSTLPERRGPDHLCSFFYLSRQGRQ